jgi:aldehyde dehydrogenase (NAD+)
MHGQAPLYRNLVAGQWVGSRSAEVFENRNPANRDDLIGLFQRSAGEDARAAIGAAAAAYDSWRKTPAPKRAEIVFRIGEILRRDKERFARDMTREMGKVLAETRGDVQEGIDTAFYAAGEGRRLFGQTTHSELPNKFMMSVRLPVGVAALITPWNFPMAIATWKMFPALVCGDTVVLKPATDTPLSAVHLVEACIEAGVPPGVVNLVTGSGRAVGSALIEDDRVRIVSFTGSTEVGRSINRACADSFKRVSLEMGGKNAIIILEDADLELALEGVLWGAFGTTGQRCTATSRVIVDRQVMRPFLERLVARAQQLKLGDGLDGSVEVGPLINENQLTTVDKYVQIGKDEGARLLCGGERRSEGELAKGSFYAPTIFAEVSPEMTIAREEIFGPVLSVMACSDLEDAIRTANGVAYGLSSALYTRDVNRAFTAMRDLDAGITYINASTIGAEVHLPFGGTKQTGNGHREAGTAVLDLYTEWKSIYVDFSGKLQKAQIDNN